MEDGTKLMIGFGVLLAGIVTLGIIGLMGPDVPEGNTTQQAMNTVTKASSTPSNTQKVSQSAKATTAASYDPNSGALPRTIDQANQVLVAQYVSTNITQAQIDAANSIVNSAAASAAFGPTS